MTLRTRPIHCKFETLRLAGDIGRVNAPYHRGGLAATEQLTARCTSHVGRIARPLTSVVEHSL
ncbi:hypothetical protein [Peteryoungia ipomoeae]|uniref:Uncharacterized protein n=1 Tax=Peteryoungia ipomoeae TaxID=1210932 RepID=A0A4S8P8A2_9HYPH|nr:hypothetical protein [Peteryoungia ipomoeae]THV25785.1 hypothetical protein FAA97_06285 [Peteryoungia ipomoeae]